MKNEQPHLQDILIAIDKIESVANNTTFDDFIRDYRIHDIAMYNFIIVGEAANRIPSSFKENNSTVEWHKLRGMRNHLAHSYDEIDYEIIWDTIKNDLPILKNQINILIKTF